MSTIKTCKRLYNPDLQILGILITMYNGRLNLSMQVMDELKKYYAGKLFRTTILRNVKLSEAPSYGSPIMYYDKHCKGAEAYDQVSDEIIDENVEEEERRTFGGFFEKKPQAPKKLLSKGFIDGAVPTGMKLFGIPTNHE